MSAQQAGSALQMQGRRVMNLAHFVTQAARRHPNGLALVWGELQWTWRESEARIASLVAGLASLGIGHGDRVLVHSKNTNELFELTYAIFRIGAVFVPTNFRLMPGDVVQLANIAKTKLFICHADFPEHAEAVMAGAKSVERLICTAAQAGKQPFGETSVDALIKAHPQAEAPMCSVGYDDPCWFFFTSGTTGLPKAAVLTHGQMAFVVNNHLCDLMPGTTERDASLVVAPLSHGAGVHALTQVARGALSILMPTDRLDPEDAWTLVEKHRVSNMFTVPTILKMLIEHPAVDTHDHSSLRYVIYAGAPMYREDQKTILLKLGKAIVQYFGLGEVTGAITVLPPELHSEDDALGRPGTCGFERCGMQVSIQDAQGHELKPMEQGEICVAGPAVFAGYYANPEANTKAFRDGWFLTGDLGHIDAQGFVYITGRASDMYISGGSNIYPREIEEKLLMHPALTEAAVLGVPDRLWGEVGVAVCVIKPGMALSAEELLGWLEPKVSRYKMPRKVYFWDALPRSGYGKVTKKLVKEEMQLRGLLEQAEGAKDVSNGPQAVSPDRPEASEPMRLIRQPGKLAVARALAVPVGIVTLDAMLPAGTNLISGLAALMQNHGIESACLTLSGGSFEPFLYVIPSPPPDKDHAAFYSQTYQPEGGVRLETATGTLGLKDGKPFFHCHATWFEADGRRGCGHVLSDSVVVSSPMRVQGGGMVGARFEVQPDSETGFSLFMPKATGISLGKDAKRGLAVRLAPNQDLTVALEDVGRAAGFQRAVLHGGVASLIGARFTDAPPVEGYAAEILVTHSNIRCADDAGAASEMDIVAVDLHGAVGSGRLVTGDNPILMTFEGLLEAV